MKIINSILLISITLLFNSCQPVSFNEPNISLEDYTIVDGFDLQVIASEPFLEAPVSMDFDNQGRMWVVEMKGYMQNLKDSGCQLPNGTISILEDLDKDGIIDHSKIFLDSLILPRAIAHVYGGLLYAEPPFLYFVEIENDKPVNKIIVDSTYSDGGNVEHQPNGLMINIDNWIYSAKSNFRYQRVKGEWIKEPTSYRGQWGISRDNMGRLYYNNNSVQLIGDFVLPNTTIRNPYFKPKLSVNKVLTKNQRVYPLHATLVNRGYIPGILDQDSLLVNVTSACGPLIYRGDQFSENYFQNAFVCVPEANLIKRNILTFEPDETIATQAYDDREFIASTDEGFRPVNLFNGPDGAMYIVDMHRGIIQDKAFLSPYLYKQLAFKKLDTIIGMGRILKVTEQSKKLNEFPNLDQLNEKELVSLLKSSNAWLRDKAQQLLIHRNAVSAIPAIRSLSLNTKEPLGQLHALHTLNGLDALSFEILENIAKQSEPNIVAHTLILFEDFASFEKSEMMAQLFSNLLLRNDPVIDLYLCMTIGKWAKFSESIFFSMLIQLSQTYIEKDIYQEAIISSLNGDIKSFNNFLQPSDNSPKKEPLSDLANIALKNFENDRKNSIYVTTSVSTDSRTAGYQIYSKLCATCHGISGDGIEGVAPPLNNSEFVKESSEKLALIILHGLQGPIHVNGKLYEFNGTMPGLVNNHEYTDEDIAHIISYVQNAFVDHGKKLSKARIKELREVKPKNGSLFTEQELLEIRY